MFHRKYSKHFIDLIASILALILLSPVYLLIALVLKQSIGSPVIFKQSRPGLKGKIFTIYKFRSMADHRDSEGNSLPDANRMTPFTKFLRSTSLDELPEFLNVLKGDMSLIGPRPLLPRYLDLYSSEQKRRHEVKPGITGWAQVNGRNAIPWPERFALDVWYVDNVSFWVDLKIIFLTFGAVLSRRGVNQPGRVTIDEFQGD